MLTFLTNLLFVCVSFASLAFALKRKVPVTVRDKVIQQKQRLFPQALQGFREVGDQELRTGGDLTAGYVFAKHYLDKTCNSYVAEDGFELGVCLEGNGDSAIYSANINDVSGETILYRLFFSGVTDCSNVPTHTVLVGSSECVNGMKLGYSKKPNYPETLGAGILFFDTDDDSCSTKSHFQWIRNDACFSSSFTEDLNDHGSAKLSCSGNIISESRYTDSESCYGYSKDEDETVTVCSGPSEFGNKNDDYVDMFLSYRGFACLSDVAEEVYNVDSVVLKEDKPSTCFSAFETVTTINGEQVAISDVNIGDQILTMNAAGVATFSEVVFVPHRADNRIAATFHEIVTTSGRTLKATRDHLIEAGECDSSSPTKLVAIDTVSVGRCIMTLDGKEKVTSNVMSKGYGVHTVVTSETSGKIVVNGVIASSFGTNHDLVNAYYHIHRAVYSMFPFMMERLDIVMMNGLFGDVMGTFLK